MFDAIRWHMNRYALPLLGTSASKHASTCTTFVQAAVTLLLLLLPCTPQSILMLGELKGKTQSWLQL
jgi:hypothetical protein